MEILLLFMGRMSEKASVTAFRELADRTGMCPAAALIDPPEMRSGHPGDPGDGPHAPAAAARGEQESLTAAAVSGECGHGWTLPRRQLWECVCAGPSVGGQSLLECMLRAPWSTGAYHALVDTASSLDPETLHDGLEDRLLWVPVQGPDQAVKALDLLLRDDNFALVAADLRGLSPSQLRKIPPFAWYRLQRLAHQRAGGALILSGMPSVRCADRRIFLAESRRLEDLDVPREALLQHLEVTTRSYPRGQTPQLDNALAG